jgi:hypothetical protein
LHRGVQTPEEQFKIYFSLGDVTHEFSIYQRHFPHNPARTPPLPLPLLDPRQALANSIRPLNWTYVDARHAHAHAPPHTHGTDLREWYEAACEAFEKSLQTTTVSVRDKSSTLCAWAGTEPLSVRRRRRRRRN